MIKERLRGVNLGGWFSQVDCIQEKDPVGFPGIIQHVKTFLGAEDFKRIRNAGFNHVRLPVDYFNMFEGDDLKPKEEMFTLMAKASMKGSAYLQWTCLYNMEDLTVDFTVNGKVDKVYHYSLKE